MKIRKIGDTWYSSEVYSRKSFGFGRYTFELQSDPEQLDKWAVLGLFTYQDDDHEIDIEFARWGQAGNPAGWYTVQPPPYSGENQASFIPALNGAASVHSFHWLSDSIRFRSYRLPDDSLICIWSYTGDHVPPAGEERLHINLWLFQGHPPDSADQCEVIIRSVKVPENPYNRNEQPVPGSFNLTPNPATEQVKIHFQDPWTEKVVKVRNSYGVLLVHSSTHADILELRIKHWPPGIYFVSVETTDSGYVKRLIIR